MKKIIELRSYTFDEISAILKTDSMQGIRRKLERMNVGFSIKGRGKNAVFDITSIENEFKVYCILKLDFSLQTDFDKLKYFVMYLLNDVDGFTCTSQKEKCELLSKYCHISRPTVADYMKKFTDKDIISIDRSDCKYYSVSKGKKTEIDRSVYSSAWKEYFDVLDHGGSKDEALNAMLSAAKGWAIKIPKIVNSAFYVEEMEKLLGLAMKEIEKSDKNN